MKNFPMSLRKKTLLIIGITLACMIVLLYITSSIVVLSGFSRVEEQDTRNNVNRVEEAISDELSVLNGVVGDWAAWNETYDFVNGDYPDFVEEQIADRTFEEIRLNLILFINSTGGVAYGSGFDLKNRIHQPIPEDMQKYLSVDSILLRHQETWSNISGIIILPEGPMLIASRPILTNERKGPIRGSVIWGRYLGDDEIEAIGTKTHLNVTVHRFDDTNMPSEFLSIRDYFSKQEEIIVSPISEKSIAGYTLLNDVWSAPAVMLRVETPRDIYKQGMASVRFYFTTLIIIGLFFGGIFIYFLEGLILSRIFRINSDVTTIRTTKELSARVSAEGGDELSSLADSINRMLETLERSQLERHEVEKELRANRDQLAYISKAKSEFLANMSHELRTPLNSIIGFSELLKEGMYGELNEKQAHFADNVLTSSRFLLDLINDILDLSKVEAGKIELVRERMSVPGTIGETLILIKEKASNHNIGIKQNLDPQLDFIEADKQRFKQILFNLLSNAIKFSKKKGGTVTVTSKKEGDMAKFSVSDTGIGIKEEDMGKLFRDFSQASPDISKKYGGTGLGLAITKNLVELHNGEIKVESRYGVGSTFSFTLPVESSELPLYK